MSSDTLLWMVMTLAFRRYLCDGIYPTMLIGFVNKIGQLFFAENKNAPHLGRRWTSNVKRTLNAIGEMNARPSAAGVLPLDMQALLALRRKLGKLLVGRGSAVTCGVDILATSQNEAVEQREYRFIDR